MSLHYFYLFVFLLVILFFIEKERRLKEKYRDLAHYDELTGCVNFRWITEILENEISRCKRYHKEAAVIMMDIDNFKKINDRHGHTAGNLILKVFAQTVKKNVRNIDIVGRYGGEEFLIVLPEADRDEALLVLERVKQNVKGIPLPLLVSDDYISPILSFSAGISSFPLNGESYQELISVADRALYQAKSEGRDKIIVEKRRSIRVKPLPGMKAELAGAPGIGGLPVVEILNISRTGMLVAVPKDIEGKDFLCKIRFPSKEEIAEVKCSVVHKEKSDKELYHIGFSFIGASKDFEKDLISMIKKSIFSAK